MSQKSSFQELICKALNVIRAAFDKQFKKIDLNTSDICFLESLGNKQSILYILVSGIEKMGYSSLLTDSMKKSLARSIYDYIQRKDSLSEVMKALDLAGIDYIPLKGAVLCDLYPQAYMRTCSDIDVLIRERSIEDAIGILNSNTSFKYYSRAHHDAHFVNSRIHLELHFSLLSNVKKMDPVLERAWDNTFCDGVNYQYQFNPEYNVFYNVAHSAKHFIRSGGIGIRPIIDLWLLKTKTSFSETKVKLLCQEAGILGYYDACCNLIATWFENEPYTEITKLFEELIFSGGVFGSDQLTVIAHERKNKGVQYVLSRIFRTSNDIKEMFPVCKEFPVLIPLYQVVRWTHLFRPKKRKAVYRELKQLNSLSQSEKDKYDNLLRAMNL